MVATRQSVEQRWRSAYLRLIGVVGRKHQPQMESSMSHTTKRAVLSAGAAMLAAATLAPSALAATPTTVKAVNGTLWVTAGTGNANKITITDEPGSPGNYRVKDTGTGVTLVNGGGINTVNYSSQEWVVSGSTGGGGVIKALRVDGKDLDDAITLSNESLPTHAFGRAGIDTILGGSARNTLSGGAGDDTLWAGANDDTLIGGRGLDQLYGNGGDDLIWAVDGYTDDVNGGSGYDSAAVDSDTINANVEEPIAGE